MANGLNFYDLKKKLTPGVVLYIGIYRYQVSGERLQDHWSSGFLVLQQPMGNKTFFTQFTNTEIAQMYYNFTKL